MHDPGVRERLVVRAPRFVLDEIWREDEVYRVDCEPEWEVKSDNPDEYYLKFWEDRSLSPKRTETNLMNALLLTYRRLIRFVPSSSDNTVWPEGHVGDEQVRAALEDAEQAASLEDKVKLLQEMSRFDEERTVENPETHEHYRLCQAMWASKYDGHRGTRPGVNDAYITLPAEVTP